MALLTDGRFSGATRGLMVGHVAPEAAVGGPIAAVREGDIIVIDVERRTLEVELSDCRARRAPARLGAARAPLHLRRLRQVRRARLLGRGRRGHAGSRKQQFHPERTKEVNDGHHLHR